MKRVRFELQPVARRAPEVGRAVVLGIACLVVVVPFAYLVLNSLKLQREFLTDPPTIFPTEITLEHYQNAFGDPATTQIFVNSLLVATTTTAVSLVVGTIAAYALARLRVPVWVISLLLFVFLFIRFYPRITTVIPFFLLIRSAGLLDTVWAIILGHLGITIPFVIWLMLITFRALPREMEESAMMDGANPFERLWHIVIPVTTPGIVAAGIFTAFLSWNEFLIASSVAKQNAAVLSMTVAGFVTDKGIYWGPMSAMSVVMVLPMIVFALMLQRFLVQGLTLGAVKG